MLIRLILKEISLLQSYLRTQVLLKDETTSVAEKCVAEKCLLLCGTATHQCLMHKSRLSHMKKCSLCTTCKS